MGGERPAQNPPVLQQSLRVAFGAQLVQQLGRALHVGEARDRLREMGLDWHAEQTDALIEVTSVDGGLRADQ